MRGDGADDPLARFCLQLAWLLESGLPPSACCHVLGQDAPTDHLRRASHRMATRLSRGEPLGRALAASGALPWVLGRVLIASDEAGQLPATLTALADALSARARRRRQILSALSKHLPTAIALLAVLVLLARQVLPAIDQAFAGPGLPQLPLLRGTLEALRAASAGLPTAAVAAAALWAASVLAYDWCKPGIDRTILALPWVRDLTILSTTARYTWTLGVLLAVGFPLIRALRLAASVPSNTVLALRLRRPPALVSRGASLARALSSSRALDPLAVRIVATGERAGRLPDALQRACQAAEHGLDRRLDPLLHAIPLVISLLLASAIALLGLAVLEPLRAITRWLPTL